MDLRPFILSNEQLTTGIDFIRSGQLFYQPFILSDNVEVGEGQNLHDEYRDVTQISDYNVYAPQYDVGGRKQPGDPVHFRKCNQEYREIYNYIADQICKHAGDSLNKLTFAEIGCNTGLNLFNLAVRGAKSCHGYDWNDLSNFFSWMNGLLGTDVRFTHGIYDNLYHRFKDNVDVPEVDIMINAIFTNHQCDPLQFLSYLCDRARKGVFLWALIHPGLKEPCIVYTAEMEGDILRKDRPFPLSFYNGVVLSEALLKTSLKYLGFGEVQAIDKFGASPSWDRFQEGFRMYYARRTEETRSAYWNKTAPID
jgi:hypothetical protein